MSASGLSRSLPPRANGSAGLRRLFVASMAGLSCLAQASPTEPTDGWTLQASASGELLGQGLPVLALDHRDWPNQVSTRPATAHALYRADTELAATHASGWRLASLARAEAWVHANADAVSLAGYDALGVDPPAARAFEGYARAQSWQGYGLRLGTPWWRLDSAAQWHWQGDLQLLRLGRLRQAEVSGNVNYQGAGVYDFDLLSRISSRGITSPFLPDSGASGAGASLSLALRAEPAQGWSLLLRGDDLASRLRWSSLATDTSTVNSQVTSRAADGTLDYAALINGRKALLPVTGRIGAAWQARLAWAGPDGGARWGGATLRAERKAGVNQAWLGWQGEPLGGLRCAVELEPQARALSLELQWRGLRATLATDARGSAAQYRAAGLAWVAGF